MYLNNEEIMMPNSKYHTYPKGICVVILINNNNSMGDDDPRRRLEYEWYV